MAIIKKSYVKNTTNWSKAELSRKAKKEAMKVVRQRDIARQQVAASKKINDTWTGNKKAKSSTSKAKRSTSQLRAIYAKKK